ncbi:MAG: thiamine pyrophosphate-binding protein [Deinococcales bacterium]
MKGAEALLKALEQHGVDVVFGHPGGAILPVYDALYDSPIKHVLVRHEQAGAHAADAYYRASGNVGVCFATSGPGATNLVTGLATAQMDSSAVVAVTGNVATNLIGTDAFCSRPSSTARSTSTSTCPATGRRSSATPSRSARRPR